MSFVLFLWLGFDGRAVEVVAAAFFFIMCLILSWLALNVGSKSRSVSARLSSNPETC